ncbi:hypothetical protein [Candidatus Similichlamydia laticola]|uniref:Uncharacterized protein n=1 Tax=Candidatus Similichlamydia laticola TaxID=2170265 RepID=A0A369K9C9_9BACT|nr:hypothetical protein [Candidatus Similichlamydia laticola]RDB31199.1 hypothetical protein HAT2_00679 [Candidatus Similichlamydia laticola]
MGMPLRNLGGSDGGRRPSAGSGSEDEEGPPGGTGEAQRVALMSLPGWNGSQGPGRRGWGDRVRDLGVGVGDRFRSLRVRVQRGWGLIIRARCRRCLVVLLVLLIILIIWWIWYHHTQPGPRTSGSSGSSTSGSVSGITSSSGSGNRNEVVVLSSSEDEEGSGNT